MPCHLWRRHKGRLTRKVKLNFRSLALSHSLSTNLHTCLRLYAKHLEHSLTSLSYECHSKDDNRVLIWRRNCCCSLSNLGSWVSSLWLWFCPDSLLLLLLLLCSPPRIILQLRMENKKSRSTRQAFVIQRESCLKSGRLLDWPPSDSGSRKLRFPS